MKERKGYVYQQNGKWYARITITDAVTGRRKEIKRRVETEKEGKAFLKQTAKGLAEKGASEVDAMRKTFADLADYYEHNYVIPARFINGQKIEGMRGYENVRFYIKTFRAFFDNTLLRHITYDALVRFRSTRLNANAYANTKGERTRSIATVNRELANLRRMLNVALQRGWITVNPFKCGAALIVTACEKRREKVLTVEEEKRLLDACNTPNRVNLRQLIIALLDTGARKGEVSKLQWKDIDLANRVITFRAENCKTLRERKVAITQRLFDVLNTMERSNEEEKVFSMRNVRQSFEAACRIAEIKHGGLDGLTLHCLRHTAATRLVKGQMPIQLVGRILGHTQPNTTYRYLTADMETVHQAASILDAYRV